MIELTFLKEFMLIKQVHQRSVIFVIIGFSQIIVLSSNVGNRCHDLLMMSLNVSDVAILNVKDSDYCCIISLISKNEAINLIKNDDLTEKTKHYKTKNQEQF